MTLSISRRRMIESLVLAAAAACAAPPALAQPVRLRVSTIPIIDTAPLHRTLATFPNHLHDASDVLREDRLTHPSAEPWANVRAVIDAVLVDPLLQA